MFKRNSTTDGPTHVAQVAKTLITRTVPLICPKCAATITATTTPKSRRALSLDCPQCDWFLDLDLHRRVCAHRRRLERKTGRPITLAIAFDNMFPHATNRPSWIPPDP